MTAHIIQTDQPKIAKVPETALPKILGRQLCRGIEIRADAGKFGFRTVDRGNIDHGQFQRAQLLGDLRTGDAGDDAVAAPPGRNPQMLFDAARLDKNFPRCVPEPPRIYAPQHRASPSGARFHQYGHPAGTRHISIAGFFGRGHVRKKTEPCFKVNASIRHVSISRFHWQGLGERQRAGDVALA